MISDQLMLMMLERMTLLLVIIYVFDIQYQKKLERAQPIKTEFKFSEDVPAEKYGYALLTNRIGSISSEGQGPIDLIQVIIQFFHNTIIFFDC